MLVLELQYDMCFAESSHEKLTLQSLANIYELQPFVQDSQLRHKAAEHRRQLFVEMTHQGLPIPKRCAACQGKCNAHKASEAKDAPKTKIIVADCLHLLHKSCLSKLGLAPGCPICNQHVGKVEVACMCGC